MSSIFTTHSPHHHPPTPIQCVLPLCFCFILRHLDLSFSFRFPRFSELPPPPLRPIGSSTPTPSYELFIYLHEEFKPLLHHCRVYGHFLFADMCARKKERERGRHPEAILLDDNKEQPSILPFPVNRHLLLMESLSRIPSLWIRVSFQLTWRHIAHVALPFSRYPFAVLPF